MLTGTELFHDISPFQLRAHSLKGIRRTNGFSCPWCYLPNALRHKIPLPALRELPLSTVLDMCAQHLKWADRKHDGFLSWSISSLFVIVHAFGRKEKGQYPVYIAGGKTSRLQTPKGQRAPMYPANALHQEFNILGKKWKDRSKSKLHTKMFTHETLSYGELRDPHRAIQHVELDELIKDGLLQLLPEILGIIEEPHIRERSGLYTSLLALRRELFTRAAPRIITKEEVKLADRLASHYRRIITEEEIKKADEIKAPFFMFIQFLALRKRPAVNHKLREWIRATYTGMYASPIHPSNVGS
jgi:hypothetical protein